MFSQKKSWIRQFNLFTVSSLCFFNLGAVPVGDQKIIIDFESTNGSYEIHEPAVIRTNSIGVSKSLFANLESVTKDWNDVFNTAVGLIPPESILHLKFKADFRANGLASYGYLFIDSFSDPKDRIKLVDVTNEQTQEFEAFIVTKKAADYRLIGGIKRQGTLRLDDISIDIKPVSSIVVTTLPTSERKRTSPGGLTYYLDSIKGDDGFEGTSPERAWKSLDAVNTTIFAPGDSLLLVRGGEWFGTLAPGGSGVNGKPIVLGATGSGPLPRVKAREKDQAAFFLSNQSYWEVADLELVNTGTMSEIYGSLRFGVYILAQEASIVRHILVSRLWIHDVNGFLVKGSGRPGAGILAKASALGAYFEDFRITECTLERCDRDGIILNQDGYKNPSTFTPSRKVVIDHNRLKDIGGDGIVPIGCDGALVEYNVVSDCHIRASRYPGQASAGIWPWSCVNTLLQFNEVYNTHLGPGSFDGMGFDCDWNCSNTVFQYNYSHDNEGGFMLVCNNGTGGSWNMGNIGSVIRYNISQNDGDNIFKINGPCVNTQIYNNTIYMGSAKLKNAVKFGNWYGNASNTFLFNNVFIDILGTSFDYGKAVETIFSHNLFFGSMKNLPDDPSALVTSPLLDSPGTGRLGISSLDGYRLKKDSPALGSGLTTTNNGGRDFFGNSVPARPARGASELTR